MDKFEAQFADLDVQTSIMEHTMGSTVATSTPQDQIAMQAWPQFRNERHAEAGVEGKVVDDEHSKDTKSPSASWEGLMAQMGAAVTGQDLSEKRIKKHRSTSELKP